MQDRGIDFVSVVCLSHVFDCQFAVVKSCYYLNLGALHSSRGPINHFGASTASCFDVLLLRIASRILLPLWACVGLYVCFL